MSHLLDRLLPGVKITRRGHPHSLSLDCYRRCYRYCTASIRGYVRSCWLLPVGQALIPGWLDARMPVAMLIRRLYQIVHTPAQLEPLAVLPQLTSRQQKVLRLLATGLDEYRVAEMLGICIKSVHGYRTLLVQRLGINNRRMLPRLWRRPH